MRPQNGTRRTALSALRVYGTRGHYGRSILNSRRAIEVSVHVVRAFVKLREILRTHKELARKLVELEKKIEGHGEEIMALFEAIRPLMEPPEKPSKESVSIQSNHRSAVFCVKYLRQAAQPKSGLHAAKSLLEPKWPEILRWSSSRIRCNIIMA